MAGILRTDTIQNSNTSTIITQTNSTTITIGTTGQTVALASGASQSGFGRAGSVNWDTTPKTTGFTAVSGNGYFVNTTAGAITVTLPATPAAGDIVAIADYDGTAATNAITVGRNSSNINGNAGDFIISKNYAAISFVYVDATAGWRSVDTSNIEDVQNSFVSATGGTITTCGDYKIHTFTGPGTFTVTNAGQPTGSTTVDYMVVAGGGSGGYDWPACTGGGGGGAGGFRESVPSPAAWTASPLASSTSLPVSATAYPITVGAGGSGQTAGPSTPITPNPGSNSIFSTITSVGGGGGMNNNGPIPPASRIGSPGGSGGGATYYNVSNYGTGNTPPVSPPQGNPGGVGSPGPNNYKSGGGGGASAAGASGPSTGNGGNGATTSISGSPTTYAGGGGGGFYGPVGPPGSQGSGGSGGGGPGGTSNGTSGVSGTTNTGGGGGGGTGSSPFIASNGGSGGSGIVIIRYKYQ